MRNRWSNEENPKTREKSTRKSVGAFQSQPFFHFNNPFTFVLTTAVLQVTTAIIKCTNHFSRTKFQNIPRVAFPQTMLVGAAPSKGSRSMVAPPPPYFFLRNRRFQNRLPVVSPETRCPSTPRRHRSIGQSCTQENMRIRLFHNSFFFFFFHNIYFPASGQAVVTGRCRPFLPPWFYCLQFSSRIYIGLSNPIEIVDFSSSVANSRSSRAFRKSICAQRKSPHEFVRVCTRGDSNSRN